MKFLTFFPCCWDCQVRHVAPLHQIYRLILLYLVQWNSDLVLQLLKHKSFNLKASIILETLWQSQFTNIFSNETKRLIIYNLIKKKQFYDLQFKLFLVIEFHFILRMKVEVLSFGSFKILTLCSPC